MPKPHTEWKVLPHGELTRVADDILTVIGDIPMPVGNMKRRMTVVRLRNGQLVVFSPVALDERQMRFLEDFGDPAFMIIPNDRHRLDARIWKDRYPKIRVIAPEGARQKVEEVVAVDATHADFDDPGLALVIVSGTGAREAALEIKRTDGTTLVLNDVVGNIRNPSGFGGWMLRLMGFAGREPHVPGPIKLVLVKDKAALAEQFRRWSDLPALKRILVSHGSIIETDPRGALRGLAASLE